jgi:hypothetical protein
VELHHWQDDLAFFLVLHHVDLSLGSYLCSETLSLETGIEQGYEGGDEDFDFHLEIHFGCGEMELEKHF